jgi:hypothetical protein
MPRTIPQKNGPGQMMRCQSVRGVHSLVERSQMPETVASNRTAKASSVIPSEEGTSAFLPRKPRNLTVFQRESSWLHLPREDNAA